MIQVGERRIHAPKSTERRATAGPGIPGRRERDPKAGIAEDAGITVTPPGDTPRVSTQLHLVDPPESETTKSRRRATTVRAAPKRTGRPTPARGGGRRAVNWGDWRLDARTRSVGRAGVARARRALEDAVAAEELSQAS